jgi:hypothetical protein
MLEASGRAVHISGSTYDITVAMRQEKNSGGLKLID